jgi:hypothetical protein
MLLLLCGEEMAWADGTVVGIGLEILPWVMNGAVLGKCPIVDKVMQR